MLAEQRQNYTPSEIEEIRAKERKRELRLIARTGQQRALKAVLLSGLFLIFALCFLYVAVETKIYNTGYAINSVRDEISAMTSQTERIGLEVDYLSSMERIEPLAMALGMVYPESADKVFVAYTPPQSDNITQSAEADIEIEVQSGDGGLSLGDKIIQVLGSLFGGGYSAGAQ